MAEACFSEKRSDLFIPYRNKQFSKLLNIVGELTQPMAMHWVIWACIGGRGEKSIWKMLGRAFNP